MEITRARLDLPLTETLVLLSARAQLLEVPIVDLPEGKRLMLHYGTIDITGGDETVFTLTAEDAVHLLNLRDLFVWQMEQDGYRDRILWDRRETGPRPANFALGVVERVENISPSFRRVRLSGDFGRFREGGLHFRILLGPKGADWPATDDTGGTVWPEGIGAWHRPVYTARRICLEGGWIEFDIFIHEGGRVSEWSRGLKAGHEVGLTGPGGSGVSQAPWLGLAGDETALPVIIRMIEGAPSDAQGSATILVDSEDDVQPVACPPGICLTWTFRNCGGCPLEAFQQMSPPEGPRYMFFAGEKAQAEAARAHAATIGLKRGEFNAVSYWSK